MNSTTNSMIIDSICNILEVKASEKQVEQLIRLFESTDWYPNKKDYVLVYRTYRTMLLSAQAEKRMWEEKGESLIGSKDLALVAEIKIRIGKLKIFIDRLKEIINSYSDCFNSLCENYSDTYGKVFRALYFQGKEEKEVALEFGIEYTTVRNYKSKFEKDLRELPRIAI